MVAKDESWRSSRLSRKRGEKLKHMVGPEMRCWSNERGKSCLGRSWRLVFPCSSYLLLGKSYLTTWWLRTAMIYYFSLFCQSGLQARPGWVVLQFHVVTAAFRWWLCWAGRFRKAALTCLLPWSSSVWPSLSPYGLSFRSWMQISLHCGGWLPLRPGKPYLFHVPLKTRTGVVLLPHSVGQNKSQG